MAEDISDARISPGEEAPRKRRVSRVRVWSLLSELARVILRGDDVREDISLASGPSVPLEPDSPIVRWQPRARPRGGPSSVWQDVQARALKAGLVPNAAANRSPVQVPVDPELPIPASRAARDAASATVRPAAEPAPAPARPVTLSAAARTTAAVDAAIDWGPVMLARISDDFARRPATAD